MGAPDQFAKATFALETEDITGGALRWEGPQEVGLTEVRLDGLLAVRAPGRLAGLPPPWPDASRHVDVGVEVKMPGDHLDPLALWRGELRRAAWQVHRAEREKAGWEGGVGFWLVAPHIPDVLPRLRSVHAAGAGVYAVGAADSPFLWVAANELPLHEALIPFLVARSGKALVEMARWIIGRRPPQWVFRLLSSAAMDPATRLDLLRKLPPIEPTSDPQLLEQRGEVVSFILQDPRLRNRFLSDEARGSLRRVLAARGLALTPEQGACIDAQSDLDVLHRWLDQAATATCAAEALA